jgi:hypothetical protein
MSQQSIQNQIVQDQNICFVCQEENNKNSVPIPCLGKHSDGIHIECLKRYSQNYSVCFCGNRIHILKYENEPIHCYWRRCCDEEPNNMKIVHGAVIFKDFQNDNEVTKEFEVTADSIDINCQYFGGPNKYGPIVVKLGSGIDHFYFLEKGTQFVIYNVTYI